MRRESERHIVLSRKNLESLLAKLDGHPPNSACQIVNFSEGICVSAEPDEVHYAERPAGTMHPETEDHIVRGEN